MNRSIINLRADLSAIQLQIDEIKNDVTPPTRRKGDTGDLKRYHKLHEAMAAHFDLTELHNFMYSIGVNPENRKPYEPKTEQTLDLVLYMRRKGRFIELIQALEKARPHIKWKGIIR